MGFSTNLKPKKRFSVRKLAFSLVVVFAVLLGGGFAAAQMWQTQNLRPVSSESSLKEVEIVPGSSVDDIAELLHTEGIIRSQRAFTIYVRSKELADSLKAGVYELDPSKSTQEIVIQLIDGKEASDMVVFPPGARLDQVKARLLRAGFQAAEIDAAFSPEQYQQHPALFAKPKVASLEGYLYPETFTFTSSTSVKQIVEQSLDEMSKRLTPEIIQAFSRQGLSPHEGITLASVVEEEVPQEYDRRVVAQIFLKRLREGIPLGADATYEYAAAITGEEAHPELDNPYNTRKYAGLPPGPISNVEITALNAVANPTDTNYLFFVSGDDVDGQIGKNYFATTQEEHEENIRLYCNQKCGR